MSTQVSDLLSHKLNSKLLICALVLGFSFGLSGCAGTVGLAVDAPDAAYAVDQQDIEFDEQDLDEGADYVF